MSAGDVAQILTALGTLIAAVGAVVIGLRNSTHIKKVETATNGMKSELVAEVRKASFAAGEKSEKDKAEGTAAGLEQGRAEASGATK